MSSLPSYVVLQSCLTTKYLDLIEDDDPLHGNIGFTGDSVLSPYAKIAFVESEIAKGCVHIRCCYNNKYWTRKSPAIGSPIVAEAKEPKPKEKDNRANQEVQEPKENGDHGPNREDLEPKGWDWDCTLFKVEQHANGIISIRHMGTGDSLCVNGGLENESSEEADECPFGVKCVGSAQTKIASEDPIFSAATYLPSLFKVINLSSIAILPRHVAFKGDNGQFLRGFTINKNPFLQFSSNDSRNSESWHEVFSNPYDGTIRFKSKHFNRFWRRSPNWIWADSSDTSLNNCDTRFWAVKVGSNKVALKNVGNGKFCSRLTAERNTNCLNADSSTARREATLEVEDLVLSREIYNVKFRPEHGTIYDERDINMSTMTASNFTDLATNHTFRFAYTERTTQTWSASVSLALGVTARFRAGIPFVKEARIMISAEIEANFEWEKTTETVKEFEKITEVPVPPKKKVTAYLIATEGKFDVPFSYTQRDTLIDGKVVTYNMNDGLYYGGNVYNVHVEVKDEPIN